MTELSPLGTLCTLKNKHLALPKDEQLKIRLKQGRAAQRVDPWLNQESASLLGVG
jgi:fatty-acyl-CoA synthase